MLIRRARKSDLEAVLKIENSSFEAERFTRPQLLYLMTKARGLFLVLELKAEIAAYLSVLTHKTSQPAHIFHRR